MITKIKTFLRLHQSISNSLISLSCKLSSTSKNEISSQIRTDLIEKLQQMNIRTSKSIFIQQQMQQDAAKQNEMAESYSKKKKNKYQNKILTEEQKRQLGLMIPKSPFNLRMGKQCEQQYRQMLCQDLYEKQKQNLNTTVRILQLQNAKINIDQYINSTYKDIFSRYMVSRGMGVEWQANHSCYGVMNPKQKSKQRKEEEIKQFYQWVAAIMQEYGVGRKQVIGIYSYAQKKYIGTDDFEVENVYKIGYFFKFALTEFGKFGDSFKVLTSKGQKIDLLVMVEDPAKLLNIEAICVEPNTKMIILTRFQINGQNTSPSGRNQYLITSMEVYTDHKQYFTQNGYTKHSLFQSKYLFQMQAQNGIPILQQIQGYSRKGGVYVVDRFSGLPDFQRAQHYDLPMKSSYLDDDGTIINNSKSININEKDRISITDPNFSDHLLTNLQKYGVKLRQIDLYSTYQDQIYSYNNEKLHFRVTHNYVIPVPQSHKQQLNKMLEKAIITESKVKVPSLNRYYPKPRDKRSHKKQIKRLLKQQTQYMSLEDSLQSIDHLPFSTIHNEKSRFSLPIFVSRVRDQRNGGSMERPVLANNKIKQLLKETLIVQVQEQEGQNTEQLSIKWDIAKLNAYMQLLNAQINNNKIELKFVPLSINIFNAFQTFKNYSSQSQLSNVVIEPQSKTQDIVPYFFHLHFMIHKIFVKESIHKQKQKQKGRRTKQNYNSHSKLESQYENKLFSLIKFHPTIEQSQRNRKVDQILFGVAKANNQQQYGYGLQALRLWVARNDAFLGDRKLSDKDVNKELEVSAFIRKVYWEILPLMNIDLDRATMGKAQNQVQVTNNEHRHIERQKLSYLHRFMIDHIHYYIINMEECYKKLQLNKALQLTEDFFKSYVHQIFLKTVRKRIIAYPLHQHTKQHIYVLTKILDLLAVVAPLLPYSAFHISKLPSINWPEVKHQDIRPQLILNYNRMTKLRVEVRNKFILNSFHHSQLLIPIQQIMNDQQKQNISEQNEKQKQNINERQQNRKQQLSQIWRLSKEDLQLFFGIQNISLIQPKQFGRCFKLKLKQQHPIGEVASIKFYQYKEVCIRCSPQRNYGLHLCQKCLDYLNNNYGKKLPLIA